MLAQEWKEFVEWIAANPEGAAYVIVVLVFMWLVK